MDPATNPKCQIGLDFARAIVLLFLASALVSTKFGKK